MENNSKRFWQRFARFYGRAMKSSDGAYDEVCQYMIPSLRRTDNVLELACGTGQLSFRLASRVSIWEATDYAEEMIAQVPQSARPHALHFSVQDATHLPYGNGSFDAVVIANALHIMPDPEAALGEIHRVLKPDGILFAPTFMHEEKNGLFARIRLKFLGLLGFRTYHKWDMEEFQDFIEKHGFTVSQSCLVQNSIAPLCYLEARPSKQ